MNIETNRLNTFTNWPASAPVDPIRIAKAGFFYTGEGTEVQCFSCGGKISQWNYGDQVMWRHRNLEPNCAFVVNPQLSGNVPLVLGASGRECPTNIANSSLSSDTVDGEDYGHTDEDEMYKSDALRLLSFINWDDPTVSREALVNAGFYHAGEGRLRCAWCGGELAPFRNLGSLGHPLAIHRMYFPRCSHAVRLEVAQRVINLNNTSHSPPPAYSPQTQTPPDSNNRPQSSVAAHNERVLAAGATWRALGVVGGGARHPAHASLAARLATFERWPADRAQTPRGLAEAGFFYTGTDDQVRCFYCDGGLGKWEAGDAPWGEHARWFPHCGYVLLVKGQQYVDSCRPTEVPTENRQTGRRQNSTITFPVNESQVNDYMESEAAMAALGAGLDAARVRRAIVKRLRTTGLPFSSSEALIDAVLDEQLNEEAWGVDPRSQRLARDILADTLREFAPRVGIIPSSQEDSSDSRVSPSSSPSRSPIPPDRSRTSPEQNRTNQTTTEPSRATHNVPEPPRDVQNVPEPSRDVQNVPEPSRDVQNVPEPSRDVQNVPEESREIQNVPEASRTDRKEAESNRSRTDSDNVLEEDVVKKKLTLEEENRQLKEARLCKVCMDSEVGVVFLPCGHLAACGRCGAALLACPLCRAPVKALVRAYLA